MSTLLLLLGLVCVVRAQDLTGYNLTFDEEFNYVGPPHPSKWFNLVRTFTSEQNTSGANVNVNGTNLVIETRKDGAAQGYTTAYTSGRIQTATFVNGSQILFAQQYGIFEARIKCPPGSGFNPAFWMKSSDNLGTDTEIDIFEEFEGVNTVTATIHWASGDSSCVRGNVSSPPDLSADYHIYSMKWAENDIKFFFDGVQYAEFTPSSVPAGSWVFNKPFYVILAQGVQDTSGTVPADMLVDWVRVYQSRLRLHHLQRKLHRGRVAPDPKPNWH